MPQKHQKTHNIAEAHAGPWFALWEVGSPYIEVFPSSVNRRQALAAFQRGETFEGAVHAINTMSDEVGGRTPGQYVKDELKAWADEDGQDYIDNGWN